MIHKLPPFAVVLLLPFVAAQQPRPLQSLEAATRVFDCREGAELAVAELLDRLAAADVVFLGETHVDDTTHRVELAVLEGLIARKKGKIVLSMEMFERDVQPVLDDYLASRIDEQAFLHRSRPWGNYAVDYRPLIETAKQHGIPVVAANFPTALRRKLGMGGKAAFDKLSEQERALMPLQIHPASEAYWQRVDRAVRGHMGGGGGESPEERLYDGQNLWDNAMGDNVAKAAAAHPDHTVLHIAGGFHVAYRDGTVAQFRLRNQSANAVVAEIAPTAALFAARPDKDRDQADYLVYAQSLARSENEGTFAVEVPAELRYRLSVPVVVGPWPLLIWLPDRGTRPEDALAFWGAAFGSAIAVAVVEPPFPELQDDLALGGRYVFGDGFRSDYGRVQHGLERIVEYLTRRYAVDPQRVVIAGAGDGGAAVLWAALYSQWLDGTMLAQDPTDLTRLSMEALPDQKPAVRELQIAAHVVPEERLQRVAGDYRKVGATARVVPFDGSTFGLRSLIGVGLGLGEPARPSGDEELLLVLEHDLPRARQWAELMALQLQLQASPARVVGAEGVPAGADPSRQRRLAIGGDGFWPIASFANGKGLPLAGGPFGGTTVLVLPDGTSDADRTAWQEIEQKKAIKRRSMFANLAIAGHGVATLPEVMADLKKRGRSRVLIVPAVFCADAAVMRGLQQQLGAAAQGMDVAWLPGLGAELVQ